MTTAIVLDKNAESMLRMLQDKLAEEPIAPDPDRDDAYMTQLRAMKYYEWERQVSATRLMLSVLLVNLALEQSGEPKE